MKHSIKKRILSVLLCISMLVPMFTQYVPAFKVAATDNTASNLQESLKSNLESQAIFDWWFSFDLAADNGSKPGEITSVYYNDLGANEYGTCELVVILSQYYYDVETGDHWYKVKARDGETLPDVLEANPWVLYCNDSDGETGFEPYLAIYGKDDVIRFVYSQTVDKQYDEDGNVIKETMSYNSYVIAGPNALKDANILITPAAADHSVSSLAYTVTETGLTFSKAFDVSVTKANNEPWSASDGKLSIRYETAQFGADTYTESVNFGGAFLYSNGTMLSAAVGDRLGSEMSDVVYVNSGSSTLVFEHMNTSFERVELYGFFKNNIVTLYDNIFTSKSFQVDDLPKSFRVACSFAYNGADYYWIESDELFGSPYIFAEAEQVALGFFEGDGYVTVTDKDGYPAESVTVTQYEKASLEAYTSLSLQTADVDYQWQIEYEDGKWVDIYGEDENTINISFGMVASLLTEDDHTVNVRCVAKAASLVAYSLVIPVTAEMYQPEVPEVVVSDTFVTSTGDTVTVSVAGNIPEDASVSLGETDPEGVDVAEGETVVASLDISIKNADGSEWQPESGETVTVSVEASKLGLANGDRFVVYHLHNGEVKILGTYVVENDTVSFDVDGFSKFVFALAADNLETPDFSSEVGKHAVLTRAEEYISVLVLDEEPTADNIYATLIFDVSEFPEDTVFSIEAYKVINEYFDITDEETGEFLEKGVTQWLWYQVHVVSGTMPEGFENDYWIFQNYLTEADAVEVDTLTLFDAPEEPEEPVVGVTVNGATVESITVTTTEPVTVNAEATFASADVSYQWQICYDAANDLWVDISGENSAEITVTAGMVISLLDENNQARVRCTATAGSKTVISTPITVTMPASDSDDTTPCVNITIDGEEKDSIYINESDKDAFASVLAANTNLNGSLTYQWDVLYRPATGIWKKLDTTDTIAPTFDLYADGVYIGNANYAQTVDDTTSSITIRLTVSDGTSAVTDTFVIYVKTDVATASAFSRSAQSVFAYASRGGYSTVADETTTTYTVVIRYMNKDGSAVVADPYTSTVSPTTELTNTVSFPNIQGYVPMVYKDGNWVRQDSYTFDGTPFTGNFELEVRYYPDAVDYKVNIYVQNAENDNYELFDSYTDQELTGTVLEEIDFPMDGYYQSKFSSNSAAIAADGSTVFNLYYDRIYYLMKFDLDGGYGVQPIYARHGVKLDIPNPTKAGYTFVGWDQTTGKLAVTSDVCNDGIADTIHAYMPIGNTAYKAIWKAVENAKVTIVYWGENANDEGYSYLESQELYVEPGTELTFGANKLVCVMEEHVHDEDCEPICGKDVHTHSLEAGCYKLTCTQAYHNHVESGCTLNCNHVHDLSCYSTDSTYYATLVEIDGEPAQKDDNKWTETYIGEGIYKYERSNRSTRYYLLFDGQWYCAGNQWGDQDATREITIACTHIHTDVCYSCGLNESSHVHSIAGGCYELTCTNGHTHTAECYECIEHTHTDSCYLKTDSYDSVLWTYVKSDIVTVAADGTTVMNVYYDRTTFTLTYKYNYSSGWNGSPQTTETITAKWGAKISEEYEAIAENAGNTFWTENSDGESGPFTNYFETMPQANKTYYCDGSNSGSDGDMTYWGQDLSGEYTIKLFTVTDVGGYSVTVEDRYEFEGFTYDHGTDIGNSCGGATFYYTRNNYILEFNNGEGVAKTESVPFETNLGSYAFTPTAPSVYEAGSVAFAGWYLNPECTGEEVVLSETTMPASNLILYAKWVPVKHNVTIYTYKDATGLKGLLRNYTDEAIDGVAPAGKITHGSKIQKEYIPVDPELDNGNYTFVTWVYYDADTGKEVAIDLESFIVTEDVEIYATWSSNVQVPYTIKYMIEGTNTEIAEATSSKNYAGETHTFNAKTAGQLYPDYQEGYFPIVSSHSIDFKAEAESYEYTFWYVKKDAVPYTVYYVTETQKDGLTPIELTEKDVNGNDVKTTYYIVADTKTVSDNRNSIVTENFVTVSGYMPDAYQKTLIVNGADGAVNQIIFKYKEDTTHAYYKVTHYTQQIDGSWFIHSTYENVGTIGDRYTEGPMTITGFTYSKIEYVVNGTVITEDITTQGAELTADGLAINLYYTRNKYPYTVKYMLQGTSTVLHTVPNLEEQYYGAEVSHTAPQYWGDGDIYERVSAAKLSDTIQTDATQNEIIFYYVEREVTINYTVHSTGGGTVNPTQETVLISSEDPDGSKAEALPGYKFIGWYDSNNNELSTELTYVPKKVNGLNVAATYIAKFEQTNTTINYKIVDPDGNVYDANQACGALSSFGETVLTATGTASGSTATNNPGYSFVGWYDNASCTGTPISTNANFVPTKDANALWVDDTTYYAKFVEDEVVISYKVVGPDGCGTVALNDNSATGTSVSETIGEATGDAQGATANKNPGYEFKGWFTNEACTIPVDSSWISGDVKLDPQKVDGLNVSATYYAKFEEIKVTINYVVDGVGGTVAPGSEEIGAATGTASGSTAAAKDGYTFAGWYDKDGNLLSSNEKYVPTKADNELWVDGTTYYAKFTENKVVINYVVKDSVGGTVAPGSEELGAATGVAQGSTATAKEGYTFAGWYSDEACTQKVSDALAFVPKKVNGLNVAATYYAKFTENTVTINYVAVGPNGATNFGSVSPESESVLVVTGKANGSTATANAPTFKFVGWYVNESCTGTPISTDAKFVPTKVDGTLWKDVTTFYAKFEYNLTTLTIEKLTGYINGDAFVNKSYDDIDKNQTFIFTVSGKDAKGNDMSIYVTVHVSDGSGSTTIDGITVGQSYTITEKTDWSWRYDRHFAASSNCIEKSNTGSSITIVVGLNGEVTFMDARSNEQWLDGDSWCDNNFSPSAVN